MSGNTLFGHDRQLARRWWEKALNEKGEAEQPEFDIVTESTDRKHLLIGWCKWTQANYVGHPLTELKRKASPAPFTKGKRITYALFLREHLLDNEEVHIVYPDEVIENIAYTLFVMREKQRARSSSIMLRALGSSFYSIPFSLS